jgi:hypothetical protein
MSLLLRRTVMADSPLNEPANLSRRRLLQATGLAAGALALPALFHGAAAQAAPPNLILRTIPKTGEKVPAIGLGTFLTFDIKPGQPRDHLREIMKRFYDGGGRVVDTSPLYGMSEVSVGDFATSLGICVRYPGSR